MSIEHGKAITLPGSFQKLAREVGPDWAFVLWEPTEEEREASLEGFRRLGREMAERHNEAVMKAVFGEDRSREEQLTVSKVPRYIEEERIAADLRIARVEAATRCVEAFSRFQDKALEDAFIVACILLQDEFTQGATMASERRKTACQT